MKFSLLTSVSSAAIGAGMLLGGANQAQAALNCMAIPNACIQDITNVQATSVPQSNTLLGTIQVLDYFNPTPNTHLTSVVISESGQTMATGTQNTGATAGTLKTRLYSTFTLVGGAGAPASFPSMHFTATGMVSNILTANTSRPNVQLTGSYGPQAVTLKTLLATFKGTSSSSFFTVNFLGNASTSTSGPSGSSGSFAISALSNLSVTYNFTTSVTTPEPASMAILGAGMAGLGVMRRRRKTA